jgi:hypothetical protein
MQLLHLQPLLHDEQCKNGGIGSQHKLHLQQTLPMFGLEPYKHQNITKLNPNTPWMKCNKKIINIVYYCFLPSMNHSRCRTPTLAKCGGEAQHLEKVGIWSPPGLPHVQSSTARPKKTSHWSVFDVIGKVLKRRYRKCSRIGHLDICSPSYGQKKGQESNLQFDSRPLKVRNRPLPDIRFEYATWRWKDLDEGYNFGSDLIAIQLCSGELWPFKVLGVPPGQFRDSISGVPGICAIWMPLPWRATENTIGSKVMAYSRVRAVVSLVCPNARGKSQHPRVSRMLN